MATLTKDKPRAYVQGNIGEYPVAAATKIFEGAAVGLNAGYARPLQAGDLFAGFAEDQADNSSGSAGAVNVRTKKQGTAVLPIAGLAITDVGSLAYASDDDTFTLTLTANTLIGHVERWVSSGIGEVAYRAFAS